MLISCLSSLHLCDWSLGRMYGWKYGRWRKESQCDSLFEKQAELFFDDANVLCRIIVNKIMEVEVVATKKDYGNRGFAKIMIIDSLKKPPKP
jgi:hypothetical protein